jgi:hypothetical protein
METIELDITEANELTFKVQIEGADGVPANIRLVCEGNDVSYMFRAHANREPDTFDFVLPSMKGKLREGRYAARVEVLLENKYFSPVEFELDFKEPVKVVAEAVTRTREVQKPEPKVAITAVQVKKPESLSVREERASKPSALRQRYTDKHKQ